MINDKLKGNSFKVLIHCAAGIHRTGVVTYTLLRINGYSNENAMNEILQMRKDTYEGVGQWRI
jgi:protein-tyrosine phosphatase